MEMAMTDRSILIWVHEMLGVGLFREKDMKQEYGETWKKQWRWRAPGS